MLHGSAAAFKLTDKNVGAWHNSHWWQVSTKNICRPLACTFLNKEKKPGDRPTGVGFTKGAQSRREHKEQIVTQPKSPSPCIYLDGLEICN